VQAIYSGFGIPRLMRETITSALPEARAVMDEHTALIAALRSGDTEASCRAIAEQSQQVRAILLGAGHHTAADKVST
jgi:DNA-binding GntR family transcriptional regulator